MKLSKLLLKILVFIVPLVVIWTVFTLAGAGWGMFVTIVFLGMLFVWQRPNILTMQGQRQYGLGNNTKALSILKKAHDISVNRPVNSITYAYILLRCGNADESAKVLNYVLLGSRLKPEHKMLARQNLSLVYYRNGDFAEAVRVMEMVFEDYKTSSVYGALGYYKILQNAPDARDFCLEAYEFNADDKIIIDNLILIYIAGGEYEKAKELSDKTIAAGNKGVEVYYHAGQVALALGDKLQAKEMFLNAQSCTRSFMTTVSEQEIETALERL